MRRSLCLTPFVIAVAAAVGIPTLARAQSPSVPLPLQAVLIRKALVFVRTLPPESKEKPKVLIIYDKPTNSVKELENAMKNTAITTEAIATAQLDGIATDARVVYLMPGVRPEAVRELARARRWLSVSGDAALAEAGDVSVGIGMTDGDRPQIIVNLRRAAIEQHDFEARFLDLVKVVR